MSSDNGIYILVTPKADGLEYRIAHQMAVENYQWDDTKMDYTEVPDVQIINARRMWKNCKVYTDEAEAYGEAVRLYKEIGYTEYGIQFINIDVEF